VKPPCHAEEDPLAADVWRLMLLSAMNHLGRVGRASGFLHDLGLTPGHMKALVMLEPGEGRPMGALASGFGCDASTMTWLVDRLEERGLVQRGGQATDRRVKTVALTPEGIRMKAQLEAQMFKPPAELASLDRQTLEALHHTLSKLMGTDPRRPAATT